MENLTKAFLISLLMSGSFMVNAMDDESLQELAQSLGLSREEYLQQIHICTEAFFEPEDEITQTARLFGLSRKEYLDQQKLYNQFTPQPQEDTSGDFDFAHQLDTEQRKERNRQAAERANADYLRSLHERESREAENLRQTFEFLALEEAQMPSPASAPFKQKIQNLSWDFSQQPKERAVLEKFMGIFQHLKGIPQNADVHVLDNYVFGQTKAINTLLEVGRLYEAEEPILTLAQIGQQMVSFVNENKESFNDYKYEGTALNSGTIIGYLNAHFSNMDNEIKAYSPEAREVWSRAWTLALNLYKQDQDLTAIQIIFDQAVEGYVTRGGCTQGRIDRGFVGYANLLCRAGVNLP